MTSDVPVIDIHKLFLWLFLLGLVVFAVSYFSREWWDGRQKKKRKQRDKDALRRFQERTERPHLMRNAGFLDRNLMQTTSGPRRCEFSVMNAEEVAKMSPESLKRLIILDSDDPVLADWDPDKATISQQGRTLILRRGV